MRNCIEGQWKIPGARQDTRPSLMIWGYFDESGKLAHTDFICLCGYLSDDRWENFSSDWGILLKRHGLPALHISHLVSRRTPYENIKWNQHKENEVLGQFVRPIREHTLAYFGIALDAKHYRSLPREAKEAFGQKEALDLAFQRLLRLVILQLREWNLDFAISINFDYTEDFSAICLETLRKLRTRDPEIKRLVSAITFADSNVYYPLQAADMLAYGTNRRLRDIPPSYYADLIEAPGPGPRGHSEIWMAENLDETWRKIKSGEIPPL